MKITCPHCAKTVAAPDKYAGRTIKCPGCQGAMQLPTLEELGIGAPPPAPPPAPAAPKPVAAPPRPAPRPASSRRSAPPPAPGPAPAPPPAAEEEPPPESGGDELAPAGDADVDDRADTRRDSRRASKPGWRQKRFAGSNDPAVKSYNRNMNITGGILIFFGILWGLMALLMVVLFGAMAAAAPDTASAPNSGGILMLAGTIAAVAPGVIGLLNLVLGVLACLKKHWVNWAAAILYGLIALLAVIIMVQEREFSVSIGFVAVVVVFVLSAWNIVNYGKVRAAADPEARPLARPRRSGSPTGRSGRPGSGTSGAGASAGARRPLSRRRR